MSNKSEQIVEQLLGAINILAEAEIKKSTKYDTTQNAEIIDATERDIGKYWVSPDGKTRYVAYCDPKEAKYRAKDKVRVAIPQSDYSNKKYIVGKQYDDGTGVVNYVSPLESTFFPDAEDDRWTKITQGMHRLAYFNGNTKHILYNSLLNIEPKYNIRDIYNVIAIKFNACVADHQYHIVSGTYGVKIILHCEQGDYECEALSSDMIGNPYTFMVPSPQVFKFNISPEWGDINSIDFQIYQDKGFDYLDSKGQKLSLPENTIQFIISDLYCSFGGDLSSTDNFTLKIIPAGDKAGTSEYYLYNYEGDNSERYVGLQWINMSEDGEYIGFSDGRVVKKEDIDRDENSTQTLDDNTIASYKNNNRDYYQHYDEIKYRKELKKNEELLSALKEDYPTNKTGLELIIQYNEVQNKLTQIEKNITEIMGKIKSYQGLFSHSSGLNSALSDKIDSYLTYRDDFADYGQKLCKTLDNGIKNEYNNKIKGETYNSPIEFEQSILQRLGALWTALKSFDLEGTGNKEDDFYKNEINTLYTQLWNEKIKDLEPGFTDCKNAINTALDSSEDDLSPYVSLLSQTDWIENNANFYSLYWYVKDEKQKGDLIAGDGWRAVYADYGSQSLCLPNTCKDGFLSIYPKKVSTGMTPDKTKQTRVIKAILVYNHTDYHSNEITFINAANIDGVLVDSGDGLKINHRDNSKDAYTEYGQYRKLKNVGAANTKREIDVTYETDDYGSEVLNNATVNWYVPASNTMLRPPSSNDLTNLGLTQVTTSDRAGYYKYTRKIYFSEKDQSFVKDNTATNQFCYYIKNNFNNLAQNNSIICEIVKPDGKKYERALPLSFSTSGTNGLPYTLIIEPADNAIACVGNKSGKIEDEQEPLKLRVSLFNDKDEQIGINTDQLAISICSWPGMKCSGASKDGLSATFEVKRTEGSTNHNSYGIVTVSYSILHQYMDENGQAQQNKMFDISEQYAVPFAAYSQKGYYIEGTDRLVYDMAGRLINDASDETPYKLFNKDGTEVECKWSITYWNENENGSTSNHDGLPILNEKNILIGSNMYISSYYKDKENKIKKYAAVVAQSKNTSASLWVQPIIIQQDVHGSTFLNEWSGQLVIDEKSNTIMSAMVGAGIKNSDNTFSGVLMGQVSKADVAPPSYDGASEGIGLYGIHKGALSYGFNVEGTAFLGKSGHGRIWFDGDKGIIQSAKYKENTSGMKIDLDDAWLDTPGFKFNGIPKENENYVWVGNNEQYIKVIKKDEEGHISLEVKVDQLSVTSGSLINPNLLRYSTPQAFIKDEEKRNYVVGLNYKDTDKTSLWKPWWNLYLATPTANFHGSRDDAFVFKCSNENKVETFGVTQYVNLTKNQTYTFSISLGWIDGSTNKTNIEALKQNSVGVQLRYGFKEDKNATEYVWTKEQKLEKGPGWYDIVYTFIFTPKEGYDPNTIRLYIYYKNTLINIAAPEAVFLIHHPKLEEGIRKTDWCQHSEDAANIVALYNNNILDQNMTFNKLTNNGTTKGIWMDDGELYINATVLGTSLLRSNNFNGILEANGNTKLQNENSYYLVSSDNTNKKIYTLKATYNKNDDKYHWKFISGPSGEWTSDSLSNPPSFTNYYYLTIPTYTVSSVTEGTCWDLNTGKLWAANFALQVGQQSPVNGYIGNLLYLGNEGITIPTSHYKEFNEEDKGITWPFIIKDKFRINNLGQMVATDAYLKGAITATSGDIGGIIIEDNGLTSGEIYTPSQESFRADLYSTGSIIWPDSTKPIPDSVWLNDIYTVPAGEGTMTFYITVGYSQTEIYHLRSIPTSSKTSLDIIQHKKASELASDDRFVINKQSNKTYLIINRPYKGGFEATLSSSYLSFCLNKDGQFSCNNAKLSGEITATKLQVKNNASICDILIEDDGLYLGRISSQYSGSAVSLTEEIKNKSKVGKVSVGHTGLTQHTELQHNCLSFYSTGTSQPASIELYGQDLLLRTQNNLMITIDNDNNKTTYKIIIEDNFLKVVPT